MAMMRAQPAEIPRDLLTPREVATMLGMSPSSVYRYLAQGVLRGWRKGTTRLLISEVEAKKLMVPVVPRG